MEADKVGFNVLEIRWFKGYQYIDHQKGKKESHQEHLKELSELPTTVFRKYQVVMPSMEGAKRGIVVTKRQCEGAKNLATKVTLAVPTKNLAKYDPDAAQVRKRGGVDPFTSNWYGD